jgi:lysophospholipase L1-like esterase
MKKTRQQIRVVILLLLVICGGSSHAGTFRDGETVCFLGDSITHGRQFHRMIYSYYLTRFPDRKIRFVNAGISGDSAGGALGRLEEDVLSKSPTSVVIMLGMNDVGRGNYVSDPTEKQVAAQTASLERYESNMNALVGRIRKESDARIILLTPTPFDQTCVNDLNNNQPGCNDGLARAAEMGRKLSAKYSTELIDLHGPMTAFNQERQKTDPAYTLIGSDRVHPGLPGNLMMAWLFLKAQEAGPMVSEVEIDAGTGKVNQAENASVTGLQAKEGGWKFVVQENALPWPIDDQAREILDFLPIEKDLNEEILRVKGLEKGTHALKIDGKEVARHTDSEWAEGINLASLLSTPQAEQASRVAATNEKRRATEVRLRGYAAVRWFLGHQKINPDDFPAVTAFLESKKGEKGYYLDQAPTYLKEWNNRAEVQTAVSDLENAAWGERIPVAHEFEIVPVAP